MCCCRDASAKRELARFTGARRRGLLRFQSQSEMRDQRHGCDALRTSARVDRPRPRAMSELWAAAGLVRSRVFLCRGSSRRRRALQCVARRSSSRRTSNARIPSSRVGLRDLSSRPASSLRRRRGGRLGGRCSTARLVGDAAPAGPAGCKCGGCLEAVIALHHGVDPGGPEVGVRMLCLAWLKMCCECCLARSMAISNSQCLAEPP